MWLDELSLVPSAVLGAANENEWRSCAKKEQPSYKEREVLRSNIFFGKGFANTARLRTSSCQADSNWRLLSADFQDAR